VSIALMGLAATFIARLLHRHRWIGYIGLVIVLYVAAHMIWEGARQVVVQTGHTERFNASAPAFLEISAEEVEEFRRQGSAEPSEPPTLQAKTDALTTP
jgi:predicted tellurium resistance membrane protein TerC